MLSKYSASRKMGAMGDPWWVRSMSRIGLSGLAGTLRRLYVPIEPSALVLEIGSGGNPFPRSNVLVDLYPDGRERQGSCLATDRPTILAPGEHLPFRDNAFDFVVACHVFEHSSEPEAFLGEMLRVAPRGYLEAPSALFERLNCYRYHRLEVELIEGVLEIYKKPRQCPDPYLRRMYMARLGKSKSWSSFMQRNIDAIYVRYWWTRESFRFRVLDAPGELGDEPEETGNSLQSLGSRGTVTVRTMITRLVRRLLSQNRRNSRLHLASLLRCPACESGDVVLRNDSLVCAGCSSYYPRYGQVIDLRADRVSQLEMTGGRP